MDRGLSLVELGRVVKAHGLRGELLVAPHGGCQKAILGVARVYLRRGSLRPKAWGVDGARSHADRVIVALQGIHGRDEAEPWRDAALLARARDVAAADPLRWEALRWLGSPVELPQGRVLGRLQGVRFVAGQEVWSIQAEDGEVYEVPAAVRDAQVSDRLLLDPPQGLLELCRQGRP